MDGTPRIGALDGLRAVAVIAVITYHLWPDHLPSGFLGVDLFMVLSGFLITGLLVREHAEHGRIRLGTFWLRRFRRLVPAALLLLVAVALWIHLAGDRALASTVRSHGLAALTYVTNWRLVAEGTTYGASTSDPSPLLHLWSLAIEEQFYVVWPVVLVAVLALVSGRRSVALAVAAIGAVTSATLMLVLYDPGRDPLRIYYGTDTRAQAFLIGAVAALVAPRLGARHLRYASAVGVAALVALVLGMRFELSEGLYRGGFTVVAIAAACACLAATVPGPLTFGLDRPLLRGIGRISYALYLWHWPAIVLLTPERTGLRGASLVVLQLSVTVGGALLSWYLVERPVRAISRPSLALAGAAGIVVTGVALVALPSESNVQFASVRTDRARAPTVVTAAPTTTTTTPTTTTTTPITTPTATTMTTVPPVAPTTPPTTVALPVGPRIAIPSTGTAMIVGDSGMFSGMPALSAGLQAAGWDVVQHSFPGMGLTRPETALDDWAEAAREHSVDLTIVMIGAWDLDWATTNGDEAYRAVVDDALASFTAGGGRVLWLSELPGGTESGHFEHHFAALPDRHPGVVDYLVIESALRAPEGGWPQIVDGLRFRGPDGWHLCPDGAAAFAHFTLGYLGLDSQEWEGGDWREHYGYHEPPGICDV